MTHYVAIVEDAGPDKAVGVWFPDLPGCFSAGDTMDEALVNAPEAVQLYAEAMERSGRHLPKARTLSELKEDPVFAEDVRDNLVAVVKLPEPESTAAE
jgi:predicted RNase H-like HicB family nuclease